MSALSLTMKKGQTLFAGPEISIKFKSKTRVTILAPREIEVTRSDGKKGKREAAPAAEKPNFDRGQLNERIPIGESDGK